MAIDPGNIESAYCVIDEDDFKPVMFDKIDNRDLESMMCEGAFIDARSFVIERVASYGMPVGREVFDTCEWIGRFTQIIRMKYSMNPNFVYRIDEKEVICHDTRASDANIRRALIDRFAKHDLRNGKGTKKKPDWFYGFKADVWAAYSVGLTYLEAEKARIDMWKRNV